MELIEILGWVEEQDVWVISSEKWQVVEWQIVVAVSVAKVEKTVAS